MHLLFDFYGLVCRVFFEAEFDVDHFSYYFGRHLATRGEPRLDLRFDADGGGSFVQGVLDPTLKKRIFLRTPGADWQLYEEFAVRSQKPAPFPPFPFEPLRSQQQLFHGAALSTPSGRAVALVGASFSGKSVLSLALLREGYRLFTDDLIVLDRRTLTVAPFCRPLGIRARTFGHLPWLGALLERAPTGARTFPTPSGQTTVVHAREVFPGAEAEAAPLAVVCLLRNSPSARRPRIGSLSAKTGVERLSKLAMLRAPAEDPELVRRLFHDVQFRTLHYDLETHAARVVELITKEELFQ